MHQEAATEHGRTVSRDNWRVVVNMHLAESREEALAELEWGVMDMVGYVRGVTGTFTDEMFAKGAHARRRRGSPAERPRAWACSAS